MGDHFDLHTWQQLRHVYGLTSPGIASTITSRILLNLDFDPHLNIVPGCVISLKDGVPIPAELGLWGLLIELFIKYPRHNSSHSSKPIPDRYDEYGCLSSLFMPRPSSSQS